METHVLVAATTLLSLLVYFWMGLRVARAQQNTLEWLPLYLPSLWLFAIYWSDSVATILGVIWIFGRILYGLGYAKAAGSRSTGFLIQALAVAVLLFGALGRIAWIWFQTN